MNEYLKKIHNDAKKYMPHGENGLIWTTGTWSENNVMTENEKLNWDKWLNGELISNQSQEFNQNIFEHKILIYERILPKKEYLSSFILYQDGDKLNIEPSELNAIIRDVCIQMNRNQEGIWFYGHQGDTYNYTVSEFGTYTLNSLRTESKLVNYEANLEPLFANLINGNRHQFLENNIQLFSGIVGINKDWLILIMLNKQENITITIHGDREFCKLINEKNEASR